MRSILSTYRPRVLTVEYNSNFGKSGASLAHVDPSWMPLETYEVPHTREPFSCYYGSSAAALHVAASDENHYKLVGRVSKLDLVYVRGDLWPYDPMPLETATEFGGLHDPMTVEPASNLIDYATWFDGGTLCEAKAAAISALRSLALEKKCGELQGPCPCFQHLSDLLPLKCPDRVLPTNANINPIAINNGFLHMDLHFPEKHMEEIDVSWFLNEHDTQKYLAEVAAQGMEKKTFDAGTPE